MNETLIEALNAYTTTLEQKVSALEQRVAQLEGFLAANTTCDQHTATLLEQLQAEIRKQEERIAQLETTPAPLPATTEENEPEIEVELITEEYEEESEAETVTEPEPSSEEIVEQTPDVENEHPAKTIAESQKTVTVAEPKEETITEQPTKTITTEQQKNEELPKANGIHGKTVKDIRMAISIGDRFLFQRELFDKNPELLQKTLTDLNGLNSFDEAMAYIDSHFGWDKEQPAYKLFINALHRRFGL